MVALICRVGNASTSGQQLSFNFLYIRGEPSATKGREACLTCLEGEGPMTYTSISEKVTQHVMRAIRSSRLVALALVATFASMALQPAQAQSSDTWKSIAIIGGSTAAGAYIGHKVGGSTGTFVGAAVGASAGYAIDKRRRANEYYNQYGDNGY